MLSYVAVLLVLFADALVPVSAFPSERRCQNVDSSGSVEIESGATSIPEVRRILAVTFCASPHARAEP